MLNNRPASEKIPGIQTFRSLKNRNFRLYWSGQIISQIGTWMQIVAQGWVVYRLTDSPLMLGLVNFVALIPVVPISLVAGVISDRAPRKQLILITQTVLLFQALAMAALLWWNLLQVWHVILLSFVLGATSALEQPARLAFILDLVGKEDLSNAVALNSSAYNVARIVGPSLAGLVVGWLGEAACFFINSVSYLVIILTLIAIRLVNTERHQGQLSITGSLVEGLRYSWTQTTIRNLLLIVAVSSFFTLPYIALMPAYVQEALRGGPQELGFLMTCTGIGAIGGALIVANLKEGWRGKWLAYTNLVSPLLLLLFCFSQAFFLSLALVVLVAGFNAIRQILANSLLQLTTQAEYHGRVMSLFNLLFNGMSRLGSLGSGGLAEFTGTPWSLAIGALISLGFGWVVLQRMREVYNLR